MKSRISILFALLLAACGPDVRDRRLDEIDLSDMAMVQQLAQELEPGERPAFATFAAIHGRAAAGNCGLTLGGRDGRAPETIGEAIQAMQMRLAQFQPAAEEAGLQAARARLAEYDGPSLSEVNERLDAIGR